jgi:hypothetical protein
MRGAAAASDWDTAFAGRTTVIAEELRRLTAQRVTAALQNDAWTPARPASDDVQAMCRSFPVVQTTVHTSASGIRRSPASC